MEVHETLGVKIWEIGRDGAWQIEIVIVFLSIKLKILKIEKEKLQKFFLIDKIDKLVMRSGAFFLMFYFIQSYFSFLHLLNIFSIYSIKLYSILLSNESSSISL